MSRTTSRAVPALLALLFAAAPAFAQGGSQNPSQGSPTTSGSTPTVLPGTGGPNATPGTNAEAGGPRNNPVPSASSGGTATSTGPLRGGADVTTGGSAAKP